MRLTEVGFTAHLSIVCFFPRKYRIFSKTSAVENFSCRQQRHPGPLFATKIRRLKKSSLGFQNCSSNQMILMSGGYNKDFLSNTRKAQNTVRQSSKHTISCVKCSGMPGVPFQIYTKFTPFEEKLDVGFKFLAGQKKGREYRD